MHGDFYLVSMSLKLGDPKKSQEPCRVRCWNPETPSLQQQARLMLPPWQEELIESSAAQRGTLWVGVWISALVCLLRRVPQRALLLGLVWQEGGLRNLQTPPLPGCLARSDVAKRLLLLSRLCHQRPVCPRS